jgi:hypothetical protein
MENLETPEKVPTTTRVKTFLQKHKTKLLASGLVLATTAAVVQRAANKQKEEFLRDKDLLDEYDNYLVEDPKDE